MSSPAEFYHSLPPVIKFYGTACFLTTLLSQLGMISPMSLYFTPQLVFKNLQIWRAVMNFFFLGRFSPAFAVQLLMLARYGVQLERSFIQRGQFIWMLVLAMLTFMGISTVIQGYFGPGTLMVFMASQVVFMILYLWSREFPNVGVSFFGLVTVQGFYLPWVMLFIHTIFGNSILEDFIGIVVGHLYYFLTVLYPRSGGRDLLRVPPSFLQLLQNWGVLDRAPRQPERSQYTQPPPQAPAQPGTERTTFRGRSYRLDRD